MTVRGTLDGVIREVLPHEVCHLVVQSQLGYTPQAWISEGFCSLQEQRNYIPATRQNLIEGISIPLPLLFSTTLLNIDRAFASFTQVRPEFHGRKFYDQATSVVDYLVELDGSGSLWALSRAHIKFFKEDPSTSWTKAFQEVYGYNSLKEVQDDWLRWVIANSPRMHKRAEPGEVSVALFGKKFTPVKRVLERIAQRRYDHAGKRMSLAGVRLAYRKSANQRLTATAPGRPAMAMGTNIPMTRVSPIDVNQASRFVQGPGSQLNSQSPRYCEDKNGDGYCDSTSQWVGFPPDAQYQTAIPDQVESNYNITTPPNPTTYGLQGIVSNPIPETPPIPSVSPPPDPMDLGDDPINSLPEPEPDFSIYALKAEEDERHSSLLGKLGGFAKASAVKSIEDRVGLDLKNAKERLASAHELIAGVKKRTDVHGQTLDAHSELHNDHKGRLVSLAKRGVFSALGISENMAGFGMLSIALGVAGWFMRSKHPGEGASRGEDLRVGLSQDLPEAGTDVTLIQKLRTEIEDLKNRPPETVEKILEKPVPGPTQVVEKRVEVPGPTQIVEKLVHVPPPIQPVTVPSQQMTYAVQQPVNPVHAYNPPLPQAPQPQGKKYSLKPQVRKKTTVTEEHTDHELVHLEGAHENHPELTQTNPSLSGFSH